MAKIATSNIPITLNKPEVKSNKSGIQAAKSIAALFTGKDITNTHAFLNAWKRVTL